MVRSGIMIRRWRTDSVSASADFRLSGEASPIETPDSSSADALFDREAFSNIRNESWCLRRCRREGGEGEV